jgi:hydroxymethylglutaryl-CoA reductase (NADPH)
LQYCPEIYGIYSDRNNNIYSILMEDVSTFSHFDTIHDVSQWDEKSILIVLRDMAKMHSVFFDRRDQISEKISIFTIDMLLSHDAAELLHALTIYNTKRYPNLIPESILLIYEDFIDNLNEKICIMKEFPMTLIHNDFNPRNLCLRNYEGEMKIVLYDWELACFHNPQRDLIEFLVYTLKSDSPKEEYDKYTGSYVKMLEEYTGRKFSRNQFLNVLYTNALYMAVVRFNLYLLANNILKFDFMERIYSNLSDYILNSR